ncbi:MAG TPA: helix-turn-helix domain-containing protein [Chthoniobacterales bacterium]|nr:helix-turn-helix domain-containing protein [Chthoniobacterales bacterium]
MTYFLRVPVEMKPVSIGILGFDGVTSLDLAGPLEAFAAAKIDSPERIQRGYQVTLIGVTGKTFTSESGAIFKTTKTLDSAPALDTVIVPGGIGIRSAQVVAKISDWLRRNKPRRIVAVSTGVYAIAATGLLDNRQVTTHWRFAPSLAREFPSVRVSPSASFFKDGPFYSCGGGTAAIEMTLSLIEEDHGKSVALDVARELVVDLRPPGEKQDDIKQYDYQLDPTERLADLPAWIVAHLRHDLSVESLAKRTSLCPRHFSRLFKQIYHTTPATFVEEMRLNEARRRLLSSRNSVATVATSVGFKSTDAFRRAFERRFKMTPRAFRAEPSRKGVA